MKDGSIQEGSRIGHHAILGDLEATEEVTIFFEGKALKARAGEPIMSALIAAGVKVFRYTKKGSPRRMFCGIGRCTDCVMMVDGVPGVRTCVTDVRDGMTVERQKGVGSWKIEAEAGDGN
ncbi:MAG: (2Fe-2S)-binding protein [Rectinemataceae bacterium]|nr:(2Fe-2S)-binding protein [Rectinemataceae bacterium]HWR10250.1 (2Fe-2S)-binding protein [Rectinemataceae bacterium]